MPQGTRAAQIGLARKKIHVSEVSCRSLFPPSELDVRLSVADVSSLAARSTGAWSIPLAKAARGLRGSTETKLLIQSKFSILLSLNLSNAVTK